MGYWTVLRHGQPSHDTTLGRGAGRTVGRMGRVGRRWGVGAGARGACGARGRGSRGERHERAALALGARPGRAAGQRSVHLVHSACFWPGLTQYCFRVNFWTLFVNPVHEHCSSQNFSKKKIIK